MYNRRPYGPLGAGRSMSVEFKGLIGAHFDAFEERKWSSNRFNLERMRVREQAEVLARQTTERLAESGVSLAWRSTQDHPTIFNKKKVDAQWVLLGRDDAERKRIETLVEAELTRRAGYADPAPPHQEVALALRVDIGGFEIALRVHEHAYLDRRNLSRRLADEAGRAALHALLAALPPEVVVAVGESPRPAAEISVEELGAWAERIETGSGWLVMIGRAFGRSDALLGTAALADAAAELMLALAPLYAFVAWSESNDHVAGAALVAEHMAAAEVAAREAALAELAQTTPDEPVSKPESEAVATAEPQPSSPSSSSAPSGPPKPAPAKQSRRAGQKPPRAEPSRPSTRGGWSYRPDWQYDKERDGAGAKPEAPQSPRVTPSQRVRQRAAEASVAASSWSYSGPVRPRPEPPPADVDGGRQEPRRDGQGPRRDDRGPRRDDRGPRRDGQGPRRDGQAPPREGQGPRRDGQGPRRDGQSPRRDGQGPRRDGPAPRRDGPAPRRDGPAPRRDGPGGRRDDRGPRREGRPGSGYEGGPRRGEKRLRGPIIAAAEKRTDITWKDAEGAPEGVVNDHVRLTGGLFGGKVGKIMELTRKGYKVAVGGMVLEVKRVDAVTVVEG